MNKHKRRVRERMAATGESYSEALRQCRYGDLVDLDASMISPQTPEGRALAADIAEARARYRPLKSTEHDVTLSAAYLRRFDR